MYGDTGFGSRSVAKGGGVGGKRTIEERRTCVDEASQRKSRLPQHEACVAHGVFMHPCHGLNLRANQLSASHHNGRFTDVKHDGCVPPLREKHADAGEHPRIEVSFIYSSIMNSRYNLNL